MAAISKTTAAEAGKKTVSAETKDIKPIEAEPILPPRPLYDLGEPRTESLDVLNRKGEKIAGFTCHEATGAETSLLSSYTRFENAQCDAWLTARYGKPTVDEKGTQSWTITKENPLSYTDSSLINFRRSVYPKLIACTTSDKGTLPTAEQAWKFPEAILTKWYETASRVNPDWFDEFRRMSREALNARLASGKETAADKKK